MSSAKFTRKAHVLESLFKKVEEFQPLNGIKARGLFWKTDANLIPVLR